MSVAGTSTSAERHIIRVDKRHCPHCDQYVSLKTFKTHKRLYYDCCNNKWFVSRSKMEPEASSNSSGPTIEFSSSSEEMEFEGTIPLE